MLVAVLPLCRDPVKREGMEMYVSFATSKATYVSIFTRIQNPLEDSQGDILHDTENDSNRSSARMNESIVLVDALFYCLRFVSIEAVEIVNKTKFRMYSFYAFGIV